MKNILTAIFFSIICYYANAQGIQKQEKIMGLNAFTYYPAGYEKGGNFPLILFFPGLGEAGTNAPALLTYGPNKFTASGYNPPALVISVQPTYGWVNENTINDVINTILKTYQVDTNRIYLTGLSAGGAGIEQFALTPKYAQRVAAVVPLSAPEVKAYYKNIPEIAKLTVKFLGFAGSQDFTYGDMSDFFVRLNVAKEGTAKFIAGTYAHCCWNDFYNPAYKVPGTAGNIYDWMLAQAKSSAPPVVTPPVDTVPVPGRKLIATLRVYDNGDIEKE